MNAHGSAPRSPDILRPAPLRRRNRRFGMMLAAAFLFLVLLCAAYIAWYGGSNKPPMKPFHSHSAEMPATSSA